jgi:hypothetical protein
VAKPPAAPPRIGAVPAKPDGCVRCGKPHPTILLDKPMVERPEWICFGCFLLDPAGETVRATAMAKVREITMDGVEDD